MGFKGASLHVRDGTQRDVASAIIVFMRDEDFVLVGDAALSNLPAEFEPSETRDWQTLFHARPFRLIVVLPKHEGWVSIHERGEFHDLKLGQFVSGQLGAVVAATTWESIVDVQMIRLYRHGDLTDYFIDYADTMPGDYLMDDCEDKQFREEGVLTSAEFADTSAFDFILEDYVVRKLGIRTAFGLNFNKMLKSVDQDATISASRLLRFRNRRESPATT